MAIFRAFYNLAELMNGQAITSPLVLDILYLISLLFAFWLLVLIALTPYWLLRWMFNRK